MIAVDYDGCLAKDGSWPEAGEIDKHIVAELLAARADGATIVLWTCRTGYALERAVESCHDAGLDFDAVNDYTSEYFVAFDDPSRKIWATEYWDDKAVCVRYGETGCISRDAELDTLRAKTEMLEHQLKRYRLRYGDL